jgi:hypothetical protein
MPARKAPQNPSQRAAAACFSLSRRNQDAGDRKFARPNAPKWQGQLLAIPRLRDSGRCATPARVIVAKPPSARRAERDVLVGCKDGHRHAATASHVLPHPRRRPDRLRRLSLEAPHLAGRATSLPGAAAAQGERGQGRKGSVPKAPRPPRLPAPTSSRGAVDSAPAERPSRAHPHRRPSPGRSPGSRRGAAPHQPRGRFTGSGGPSPHRDARGIQPDAGRAPA